MTLEELIQIKDSLKECMPHVEDFSWGPSLYYAEKRRDNALKILTKEIRKLKKCSEQTKS